MNYFLGGDPGKDGAIAVIDEQFNIISTAVMPTIKVGRGNKREFDPEGLKVILDRWNANCDVLHGEIAFAAIEKSQAFPGQGATSMHSVGLGDMMLWMSMVWMGVRYERVRPQKWQKLVLSGISGSDTKGRALIKAKQLFPGESFLATERSRKPHDGIVDALLLAVYAKDVYEF